VGNDAQGTTAMTLTIHGDMNPAYEAILTEDAQAFIFALHQMFNERRLALLAEREVRQEKISGGWNPDFLDETAHIRASDWKVAPIPEALQARRVEITGPAEPKMIINALNSGAKVFMADVEDSLSPTWQRIMEAQIALGEAARGTLEFTNAKGKHYALNDETATLIVRPRGWHLNEKNITVDDAPISGSLMDFGLFFFHNAAHMASRGTGPFFYIPKLESHLEAELWNDVFSYAEAQLGITHGTIKATVLIETITAVFEMDEILYALKDYIAGLNCGRWDYIFSFIKKFHARPEFVLPDRAQVGMGVHFLKSYSELLIQTCHKRGAFAMGGMAAQIPVKNDDAANDKAFAAVRADKEREAKNGHDGTWVAHPGLIPTAMEVFNTHMPTPNQVDNLREDVSVSASDLITVPKGDITEAGLRMNANVAIQYTAAWMHGNGCVPINNLMEDAATAEISRAQLWQWAHHESGVISATNENIDIPMVTRIIAEELADIEAEYGDVLPFSEAARLMTELVSADEFAEFLTLPAYEALA